LNIDLNINNENQDCKIGTVCAGMESEGASGRGKGEGRRLGEVIWLMDFIHCMKQNLKTSCNCFKWGRKGAEGETLGEM
jgi:hypothetical protein